MTGNMSLYVIHSLMLVEKGLDCNSDINVRLYCNSDIDVRLDYNNNIDERLHCNDEINYAIEDSTLGVYFENS